jgi:hypothetical protein
LAIFLTACRQSGGTIYNEAFQPRAFQLRIHNHYVFRRNIFWDNESTLKQSRNKWHLTKYKQPGTWCFYRNVILPIFPSITNKMQRYTIYLFLWHALHVSGGSSAHHQELKNCIYSIGYLSNLQTFTAATAAEFQLFHDSDRQ